MTAATALKTATEQSFAVTFFEEAKKVCDQIDTAKVEELATGLADLRARGGRMFILGVGGSAGNAGHMVNDFRKLCGIETYAPTDNVSELTARTNDEGWETIFSEWLKVSKLSKKTTRFSSSPLVAAMRSAMSARTCCARSTSPKKLARKCSASSAVTMATPIRKRIRACGSPSSMIAASPRIPKHSRRLSGIAWSRTRRCKRIKPSGKSRISRPRRSD